MDLLSALAGSLVGSGIGSYIAIRALHQPEPPTVKDDEGDSTPSDYVGMV